MCRPIEIHHTKGAVIRRFPALLNTASKIATDKVDEEMGNLFLFHKNVVIAAISLVQIGQIQTLRT
jgi:hypothetical protein